MNDIIYQKEQFVVWKANNGYVVHNTNKPFSCGHTHLRSKQRVIEVIDNSLDCHFPLHWSNYFIESMIQLTECEVFRDKLKYLRHTRKGKDNKLYK